MSVSQRSFPHLRYYRSLVDRLEEIGQFVEICEGNRETYSVVMVQLLLAAGSEVDVVAKLLCEGFEPGKKRKDINDWRGVLLSRIPALTTVKVTMPKYAISTVPWRGWAPRKNPTWWGAYNKVKHNIDENYGKACLGTCIDTLAALCVLLGYLYANAIRLGLDNGRPPMWLDDDRYGIIVDGPLKCSGWRIPRE